MGSIFTNIKSLKVSTVKSPPTDLDIFFTSLILTQCLVTYLRLGVFLVPYIYVETYVYDDVYVRVLMTHIFVILTIELGSHRLGYKVKNILPPITSPKSTFFKTSMLLRIRLSEIFSNSQ